MSINRHPVLHPVCSIGAGQNKRAFGTQRPKRYARCHLVAHQHSLVWNVHGQCTGTLLWWERCFAKAGGDLAIAPATSVVSLVRMFLVVWWGECGGRLGSYFLVKRLSVLSDERGASALLSVLPTPSSTLVQSHCPPPSTPDTYDTTQATQKKFIFDPKGPLHQRWNDYPVFVTAWSYGFGALFMVIVGLLGYFTHSGLLGFGSASCFYLFPP